ncbi:MAG: hypothetical protein V1754_09510, partial [Pseudomonadota bacterium]
HLSILDLSVQARQLKAQAKSATGKKAAGLLRAKAKNIDARVARLKTTVAKYETKHGLNTPQADARKINRAAKTQLATPKRVASTAKKRTTTQTTTARKTTTKRSATRTATKDKVSQSVADDGTAIAGGAEPAAEQVADRELPNMGPKITTRSGTELKADVRNLKRYARNKDLNGALDILIAMEKEATSSPKSGFSGWRQRSQLKNAQKIMRKAAERVGKEAIQEGDVTRGDRQAYLRENAPAVFKDFLRTKKTELAAGEITKEQYRAQVQQAKTDLRNMRPETNYKMARLVLDHLQGVAQKHKKGAAGKVLSNLVSLSDRSLNRAHSKLDKALLKEVKHHTGRSLTRRFWRGLVSKFGVDGAMQAHALLHEARQRGLDSKMKWRFKHMRNKAKSRLNGAIKKAVREGNPNAVEQAYFLMGSYALEDSGQTPSKDQQEHYDQVQGALSKKNIAKMEKNISKANINLIQNMSKQAAWIASYPRMAGNYGYDMNTAAQMNNSARQLVSQYIVDAGKKPSASIMRRLDNTDKKIRGREGLLSRIAKAPGRFLIKQARNLKYHMGSGGVPPMPVVAPGMLQALGLGAQQGGATMASEDGRGEGPKTPIDVM